MATRSRPGFQTYWKDKFGGEFETPFSERLLNLLYFHTDVGIIPRGKLEVSPASNYYDYYNWKKPIQGCYWCSVKDTSHQAICCSSDCLILFHEWCVHKVNKTTQFAICKLPGCENDKLDKQLTCCEEHCSGYSSKFGIVTSNKGTYIPNWYIDSTSGRQSGQPNPNNSDSMEDDVTDSEQVHTNDVIMTGTDYSSFIFSKRLYEGLIYRTDVGPIPRDSYREEHMSSEFANTANWRRAIEGCYWCGKPTRSNQYTYVCDKKCYSLLHEWCRRKLCEFCGDSLCMLPGCELVAVESANCCSETHQQQLENKYKTIKKGKDTNLGTGAYWYDSKEILTNKKITQFFPGKQHQQQQQQQLPFILDRTLTELLMTLTDIGPIPRDLLTYPRIIQASQQFLQIPSNWNTYIVGCYWCCTNMSCYLGIFCDKQCFYLFNEWCFLKLRERDPSISCCKYVGCAKSSDNSSQCCKDHARQYLSEYGKFSQLLKTTNFILGPRWYNNNNSTLNTIEFYNRDEPFYEFTNFFACNSLNMDGISYPTSEHYFQSQKFVGTPYMRHISSMSNARESFDFSRSSRGTRWLRPDWSVVKERVMYRVLREKFIQNPELAYMLVSTCNAQIFEHTSNDSYWGDGGDGTGKNKLGILLMKLRDELQTEYAYFPNTLGHHTYDKLCNEYVLKPTSPLMPSVQPQSNSLSPVDFNLLSIKNATNGHNSFKQMRSTDSGWISDDDNISPNHTSGRGNSSTDSTHGVFLKPTNCTHSSPQDAERGYRPPSYNPCYITPTDVSGGEAAKPRDQTDHPESMET